MVETSVSETQTSPIRVLHLIDGLSWGGSQRWVWDIVRLSDADRFRHHIVTICPDSGDYVYADRLETAGVYRNVTESKSLKLLRRAILNQFIRNRLVPLRKLLAFARLIGYHSSAVGRVFAAVSRFQPQVIHAHTFHGFTVGILVKLIFRIPLIHSVPCLFSQMVDAGFSWMPGLYRRIHQRVDCFFTGASLEELRTAGVPASKTFEIRGVVDQTAVDVVLGERERHYSVVRNSLGLNREAIIVLSVGRFHPSKGHLFALEALPRLLDRHHNIHWVLLGEGDQRSVLERRARELGVEPHVHMAGFHADPLPFYAAANLYLRTTIFEAENLCSYQAMAMGLPVVGFDTGGETELLRKVGHGILVPNKDASALARVAGDLLGRPDRGKGLGSLGADYCRANLDLGQAIAAFCLSYVRYAGVGDRPAITPDRETVSE